MYQSRSSSRVEGEFLTGRVKLWETTKGYGFVSKVSDGGDDIFVHYTKVIVENGRFPAIAPETHVRLTFHLRQGRDTGINVTDANGAPLPGFFDKAEAIKLISGDPIQPSTDRQSGSVKWFNNDKGFGFIQPDNPSVRGEDLFVHMKEVEGDLTSLVEGERVEYNVGIVNGRYRAVNVTCDRGREGGGQGTQTTQEAASASYGQQPSLMYNPQTGTYHYANMGTTAQYGAAAGGVAYMNPASYGLSQNGQLTGYVTQDGTQLQPGQTFISNGQLYMMPHAPTTDATQSTQPQAGGMYQYSQSPATQQYAQSAVTQQFMPQASQNLSQLPQQSQGQLYQQQPPASQPSPNLQGSAPQGLPSQNSLQQPSQFAQLPASSVPSQPSSKYQYMPAQPSSYSQPQSVLHKRAAPNNETNLGQPRKMIRQSKPGQQAQQAYH